MSRADGAVPGVFQVGHLSDADQKRALALFRERAAKSVEHAQLDRVILAMGPDVTALDLAERFETDVSTVLLRARANAVKLRDPREGLGWCGHPLKAVQTDDRGVETCRMCGEVGP